MFIKARLRLTFWYTLIIMVVSLSFSGAIYKIWTSEVTRFETMHRMRMEERLEHADLIQERFRIMPPPRIFVADPELIEDAKQRILTRLMFANLSILLIAGGLGYFLSGKTLSP